jgi:hypothetical protein
MFMCITPPDLLDRGVMVGVSTLSPLPWVREGVLFVREKGLKDRLFTDCNTVEKKEMSCP